MTLTPKGQINREGRVSFGDASVSVWEESIPSPSGPGGFKARDAWELAFKRQVFSRIVQTLRRIGWTVEKPPINPHDVKHYSARVARMASERRRTCSKGGLQGELTVGGRCIKFKMWQDVTPSKNPNGGQYDFDKEQRMPYVLRLEMERTRRRIRDYLCNVFSRYEFESPRYPVMGLMGLTAEEKAAHDRQTSGHYRAGLDRAEISMPSNAIARDGGTIVHGARVWAIDHKGRIIVGTAYYSLNNNWQIVTGRYGLTVCNTGEIFTIQPDGLRLKRNERSRRSRLEGELAKAVKAMDFDRAKVLKGILWPEPEPLFHIIKNGAYFRPNYSGYTTEPVDAGQYTKAELKPYADGINRGDLRAVPVSQ